MNYLRLMTPTIVLALGFNAGVQANSQVAGSNCPDLGGSPGDYFAEEVCEFF